MELTVDCKKRPEGSKPNALRQQGLTPAVLYGHKGTESIALTLDTKTAELLVRRASVNNTLIQLNVADLAWNGKTLLREIQSHPWKGSLYHLSFFSVASQDKLQVTVPLHFTGDAIGVKQEGGALDTVLNELEVECAPDRIPETIEIDLSEMKLGDALHVSELVMPAGVTVLGEGDRVVATVVPPLTEAADAEAPAEA